MAVTAAAAAPSFYPTTLPNQLLILDAIQSPYTDAGSGRVSQWNDLSSNANHATQSTSTRQPLYLATGLNSHPTMQFDGSPRCMVLTSQILAGAKSIYIVTQNDDLSKTPAFMRTQAQSELSYQLGPSSFQMATDTSGPSNWNYSLTVSTPFLITVTMTNVNTSGSTRFYLNGSELNPTTGNIRGWTVTHLSTVAGWDFPSNFLVGRISGVYVYSVVHDATTKAAMETYLTSRWIS